MWDLCMALKAMKGALFEPIHLSHMKHLSFKTVSKYEHLTTSNPGKCAFDYL